MHYIVSIVPCKTNYMVGRNYLNREMDQAYIIEADSPEQAALRWQEVSCLHSSDLIVLPLTGTLPCVRVSREVIPPIYEVEKIDPISVK